MFDNLMLIIPALLFLTVHLKQLLYIFFQIFKYIGQELKSKRSENNNFKHLSATIQEKNILQRQKLAQFQMKAILFYIIGTLHSFKILKILCTFLTTGEASVGWPSSPGRTFNSAALPDT